MALSDAFLTPLGLAALASVVPLVVLWLVRPDPERVAVPTLRFLLADAESGGRKRRFDRLRRNLLFFLQLLVLVLVSLALATPYVTISESAAAQETVVVIDASASMATQVGGVTRFDRAADAAREAVTGTTTVVVASASGGVSLRQGSAEAARQTIDAIRVTHTEGDLARAVGQAAAVAGDGARVVVFSDFADASDWRAAVEATRARDIPVELRQFDGGTNRAGIVDLSFDRTTVTAAVRNFAGEPLTREVRFGTQSRTLALQPGDVATATFDVPPGGAQMELLPGDGFPVDDVAYVAAPDSDTVRVLVLTNDENRFLTTALSVMDEVELTVDSPPTAVDERYDVVVFSNVDPDRLLQSSLQSAGEIVESGGGVAVQAQSDLDRIPYGRLLPVAPGPVREGGPVSVADDPLTDGITFPAPQQYVDGQLQSGRPVVTVGDGAPLIATDQVSAGRTLYYGYLEENSTFKYNYLYPVFWRRAIYHLAGREPLPALNRQTGGRLQFADPATVETPGGSRTATTVALDRVGYYAVGDRRLGVSLVSADASNVTAPSLSADAPGGTIDPRRSSEQRVPVELTPYVALAALAFVLLELAYLNYRGDV